MTMFLIMLNMLVAIVMDVYADTKHKLAHGETLWQEIYSTSMRAWENWKGTRISFNKIMKAYIGHRGSIHCLNGMQAITVDDFVEAVPGLTPPQAESILTEAAQNWRSKHHTDITMAEVLSSASVASSRLSFLHRDDERQRAHGA